MVFFRNLPLATLALALSSCGGAPTDSSQLGVVRSAITGGTADEGHPAIGLLASRTGSAISLCSATLVGRRSVLTAGHCVPSDTVQFRVCLGVSRCSDASETVYQASRVVRHPGWLDGDRRYDIALVRLSRPVADIEPIPINVDPVRVADPITIVGFGKPGFGTRRVASNTISALSASQFQFQGVEAVVDQGDSGGPSLVDRADAPALAGVHATRQLAKGTDGVVIVGTDTRVAPLYSWIVDVLEQDVATAGIASAELENRPLPQNTASLSDPLGLPFGDVCQAASDCESNLCALEPTTGIRYCTHPCVPNGACDRGSSCIPSPEGGGNVCGPPALRMEAMPLLIEEADAVLQETHQKSEGCAAAPGTSTAKGAAWILTVLILWAVRAGIGRGNFARSTRECSVSSMSSQTAGPDERDHTRKLRRRRASQPDAVARRGSWRE